MIATRTAGNPENHGRRAHHGVEQSATGLEFSMTSEADGARGPVPT